MAASRGLRQGDPLSPFLFIIIMDCFKGMLIKAESEGLISGFTLKEENDEISITHLQFAILRMTQFCSLFRPKAS